MVSKYFTVRLICKTKFPDTCHALKNSSAVKGLITTSHDNTLTPSLEYVISLQGNQMAYLCEVLGDCHQVLKRILLVTIPNIQSALAQSHIHNTSNGFNLRTYVVPVY